MSPDAVPVSYDMALGMPAPAIASPSLSGIALGAGLERGLGSDLKVEVELAFATEGRVQLADEALALRDEFVLGQCAC